MPDASKIPERLRAGDLDTPEPRGAGVKEAVRRGVDRIKNRARALKLRHEVKNVHTALEGVWQKLGNLALTHRPSEVDLSGDLAELSEVQEQVGQKQATADSLRHTKGSGSVLKELRAEIAELHRRRRRLTITIGQKVEAVKADMPGAAAHYGALERLRATLQTKQGDLATLGQELGPVRDTAGGQFFTFKRRLILAGGALFGILILYLAWNVLIPGVPRDIRKVVFDESAFSEPVTLAAPPEGRPGPRRPVFAPGGQALLNMLTEHGFARIEEGTARGPFGRTRKLSVLRYSEKIKPYVFKQEGRPEVSLNGRFRITAANRHLKSIDYINEYRAQLPMAAVETDFYAIRFSYVLRGELPGLPELDKVFKGRAKAYFDPDEGEWDLVALKLEDNGGNEYVSLIEEEYGDRKTKPGTVP
ncbi:MAG: hypothetical protein ACYSWU_15415 [Planctomycetota bacterium]